MRKRKRFSIFFLVSLSLCLITWIMLLISRRSYKVGDFLNDTVCHYFRFVMAKFGDIFPFSLYEVLLFSIPLILVIVIVLLVRRIKYGGLSRMLFNIAAIVFIILTGKNLALAIAYNTTTVDKKMDMEVVEVTQSRLAEVMLSLRDEINSLVPEIEYLEDGSSVPDYDFRELGEKLCESYDALNEEYGFPKSFKTRPKSFECGPLMSYFGTLGIYTFFTGEANVNSEYPMYDRAFTAAHEMAHQRGILRENEANFVAYLVTSTSDDVYLRYSGALSMYEYIANALYSENKELYREIDSGLSDKARADRVASYKVYEKYSDNLLNKISNFINDLYLKSNGTEGSVTYSRVVILTVAYYESMK